MRSIRHLSLSLALIFTRLAVASLLFPTTFADEPEEHQPTTGAKHSHGPHLDAAKAPIREIDQWEAMPLDQVRLPEAGLVDQYGAEVELREFVRAHGLKPPADLTRMLDGLEEPQKVINPLLKEAANKREPEGRAAAREYFTDTLLVDQTGKEILFYSDLIAGKTVVINPFFSTCSGSCPVMHKALAAVQGVLGDRLGRDVFLLSISVDPVHDTPERLSRYAEAFGAGPGWSFLTGAPESVEKVLRRIGQEVAQKEAHQAIFLVGNDRTGLWQKAFGLGSAEDVVAVVQAVANDLGSDAKVVSSTRARSMTGRRSLHKMSTQESLTHD